MSLKATVGMGKLCCLDSSYRIVGVSFLPLEQHGQLWTVYADLKGANQIRDTMVSFELQAGFVDWLTEEGRIPKNESPGQAGPNPEIRGELVLNETHSKKTLP